MKHFLADKLFPHYINYMFTDDYTTLDYILAWIYHMFFKGA